jgi:hypothetical protein
MLWGILFFGIFMSIAFMMVPKDKLGESHIYISLCFYFFWPTLILILKNFTNLSF